MTIQILGYDRLNSFISRSEYNQHIENKTFHDRNKGLRDQYKTDNSKQEQQVHIESEGVQLAEKNDLWQVMVAWHTAD